MLVSHEWIASIGGSENVFREILTAFPGADAICLWNDLGASFGHHVTESDLARTPLRGRKALALPVMPRTWRSMDLSGYDTVVASSHAFGHHLAAHAVRTGRRGFAYVHTPARYVWAPEAETRGRGIPARAGSVVLRRLDRRAVDPRVHYAANSHYVRDRIRRSWQVDAEVIHPPADITRIRGRTRWRDAVPAAEQRLLDALPAEGYLLGASRLVAYKRLDLVIALGAELDLPVVIAGSGPDEARLRRQAAEVAVPVHFAGRVSDTQLYALYQQAQLYAFLAEEDFGIMPVECMATGTPVLVNSRGGARESVIAVAGGSEVDVDSGAAALARAAEEALRHDPAAHPDRLDAFSREAFRKRVAAWVGE